MALQSSADVNTYSCCSISLRVTAYLYVVTPESRVARTTLKRRLRFVFVVGAGFKRVGALKL